jgi:hypothetical protein
MTPKTILFCLALLAIAVVPLFALAGFSLSAIALHVAPLLMVGMTIGSQLLVKDYGARITKTLPASNTVAYTAAIDLGHDATGRVPVGTEILIEAPALAAITSRTISASSNGWRVVPRTWYVSCPLPARSTTSRAGSASLMPSAPAIS